jgi:DNA-binding transcriptional MerR regulator
MTRLEALSLAELERMLEGRRAELAELTERRERLAAELAECDAQISRLSGDRRRGRPPKVAVRRKPGQRGRIRNQPPLKNVILDVLQKSKKALSVDEIMERVQASGYKSRSDEFRKVVYLNLFNLKKDGEVNHDPNTKLYSVRA